MLDRRRPARDSDAVRRIRRLVRNAHERWYGEADAALRRLRRRGRVEFGPWTYGIPMVRDYPYNQARLVVGSYCSLAGGSTIMLGGEHPTDRVTTYPHRIWMGMEGAGHDGFPRHTGDTVFGSDVWLCAGALVLAGVTVGDGAIIAGGAVVVDDVPPYAIVAGNPARVIRYRHTPVQIERLLRIRWWDWPESEVRAAIPLLADHDVEAFLHYAENRINPD